MIDDDIPTWTLPEHLAAGEEALNRITGDTDRAQFAQPVCHHFAEVEPTDILSVDREDIYAAVSRQLSQLGVDFAADRLEGWEVSAPNQNWLRKRIPDLFQAANDAGLIYCGWTWEPKGRQPVGASLLTVINNRSN